MENFSVTQKKIARLIQKDIAVEKFPFKRIARFCVLTDVVVLETIRQLLEKGFIRKYNINNKNK